MGKPPRLIFEGDESWIMGAAYLFGIFYIIMILISTRRRSTAQFSIADKIKVEEKVRSLNSRVSTASYGILHNLTVITK